MAAQNQHYVPKFILRQFLTDTQKEHVSVYDKHADRSFVTSIKNIMAERRFNDFNAGEMDVSFEPVASKIEEIVLPAYRKVLGTRRLDNTAEQQSSLALLVAFQFLRSKAHRTFQDSLNESVRKKVESMGGEMEDVAGWEPLTDDIRKREHFVSIINCIDDFTKIIAGKNFLLAEAAPGQNFYIGDCPVTLHNNVDHGPYGNLGLAVLGIEIYMPLSADLLLCAWCPSLLAKLTEDHDAAKRRQEGMALSELMAGRITASQMKAALESIRPRLENASALMASFKGGRPILFSAENMAHINSLQAMNAKRYVISKGGDFDIATRHNKEFPKFRNGHGPTWS